MLWRHLELWSIGILALAGCAPAPRPATGPPSATYDQTFEGTGFALRLELAPLPNLIYQLDCLSGAVLCSPDGYRLLWAELKLDAKDEAALVRWKTLRTRHTGTLRVDAAAASAPLLASGAYVDVAERQRIAALRAHDLDAFEAGIALLSSDADARELRGIASGFEPRFMQFWQAKGLAAGAAYFKDLSALLADPFLLATLSRVARFTGHSAESRELYRIHLLVQPRTSNPRLTAYQLEQDFVVEAPEQGKALEVIEVVAHEICHAMVFRMSPADKRVLVDAFVRSDDRYSLVDYGLFDEAFAASVGNGLVWRHYLPGEDFARHSARGFRLLYKPAGALAVALMPRLDALFVSEASIASPAFVDTLARAALASYREHGPTPLDYLHSHVLVATPELAPAAARVRDAAFAFFPYLREFAGLDAEARAYISDHPLVTAAVYVSNVADVRSLLDELQVAPSRSQEINVLAERSRGFAYAVPRTPKTYFVLFVAPDLAGATELADRFIALREMREGVLLELERSQ